MDWFIYDNDLRDGGVNRVKPGSAVIAFIIAFNIQYLIFLEKNFKLEQNHFSGIQFAEICRAGAK